ncbi:MAG: hypothetical protein Q8K82_07115 [Gemmatimonadaceae bacterium]|nr:hypothetical protein [Gemmatimonadaceae bacterium]
MGTAFEEEDYRVRAAGMPRIRDVKTETEGNDATVVESLVPLIERSRPFVSAEVCTRTPAADNVFDVYPERNIPANSNSGIFPYNGISPFGFNGAFYFLRLTYGR